MDGRSDSAKKPSPAGSSNVCVKVDRDVVAANLRQPIQRGHSP